MTESKKTCTTLLFFIIASVIFYAFGVRQAQAELPSMPEQDWLKTYGTGATETDNQMVLKTADGGYAIVGTNNWGTYKDVFIIKTDSQGLYQSDYRITGSRLQPLYAGSAWVCSDGSVVIAGNKDTTPANYSNYYGIWLARIRFVEDPVSGKWVVDESTIQEKLFDFAMNNQILTYDVQQTGDGGFIIAGSAYSDSHYHVYLMKTDSSFNKQWDNIYTAGVGSYNRAHSVRQASDGGYIVTGMADDGNHVPATYLLKTGADGSIQWEHTITGDAGQDWGNFARETIDGDYLATGLYNDEKGFLCKYDKSGNALWRHWFSMDGDTPWEGESVLEADDGGYLVAGHTIYVAGQKTYLLKVNSLGEKIWGGDITLGGSSYKNCALSMVSAEDGGVVLAGGTNYGGPGTVFLLKLKPESKVVDVKASAVYHRSESKLDVRATAACSADNELNAGNTSVATYEILDENGVSTGISGELNWNGAEGKWEDKGVEVDPHNMSAAREVKVTFKDVNDHTGAGISRVATDANIGVSSYNVMPNGNVLVYAGLTDITGERDTSGIAELSIRLAGSEDRYRLDDTGQLQYGDLSPNDGVYGSWLDIPGSAPTVIELYLGEELVDSEIVNIVANPELAVVTDISALYAEFLDTGAAPDEDTDNNGVIDFYDLLECLARYARNNNGVVFNLYQEILADNGYYNDYYPLVYGTDTSSMFRNIDLLIYKAGSSGSLKNVAIIGDDEVVPFNRRKDPVNWENDYCEGNDVGQNPTILDSQKDLIMTDVPYGSYGCRHPDDIDRPLPDAGVGRVFADHPMELIRAINGYQTPIQLNNASIFQMTEDSVDWMDEVQRTLLPVLIDNYDMGDVADSPYFQSGKYYHYDRITGPAGGWSPLDVTTSLPNVYLNMLWTHANHTLVETTKDSPLTAAYFDIMPDSPGHVLISTGCHSGYSISHNSPVGNYVFYNNALVNSIIKRQVSYIAPTVYGIGIDNHVGYHDLLLQLFLKNLLDTSISTVGEAQVKAYREYWQRIQPEFEEGLNVYAAYGTGYYGLPTQPIAHAAGILKAATGNDAVNYEEAGEDQNYKAIRSSSAKRSVIIDPEFQVEEKPDGTKLFKVTGEEDFALRAHAPVMPLLIQSFELPGDTVVSQVYLSAYNTTEYAGEVDLPRAVPVNKSTGPVAGTFDLPDIYPEEIYWWSADKEDDHLQLTLSLIPMQYSHEDKKIKLYNHLEFAIETTAPAATLAIDTASLPSGKVGSAYNAGLAAGGGTEPYTWSAFGLPAGLDINTVTGAVYGTPTTAGTSTVTVTVHDSASRSVNKIFSLTVNPASGGGGGGGGGSSLPPPVNSTTGSASVYPGAGGTVSLGSEAGVEIPAGALQGSATVQIKIEKTDDQNAAPAGFRLGNSVFRITANGRDHYQFNKPVALTFTFDPSALAPGEKPGIFYYDEASSQWISLGGTVSGNTITVTVNHFTKFAVLVKQVEQQEQKEQKPEEKPVLKLTDISGHWAENNISRLVGLGAISGYPDGTFKPDGAITRAEFAAVLVKAFKLEARQGKVFSDTANHWAGEAIATAAAHGIISGYSDTTFGPNDPVTREQMAVLVVKAARLETVTEKPTFADSADLSWAEPAVATAVKNGIIRGYPDNTFRPAAGVTRAEAATVILNAVR